MNPNLPARETRDFACKATEPLPTESRGDPLRTLARVVGLFGERGWPFVTVVIDDDERRTYPVPDDAASLVQYARKVLHNHGQYPIRLES